MAIFYLMRVPTTLPMLFLAFPHYQPFGKRSICRCKNDTALFIQSVAAFSPRVNLIRSLFVISRAPSSNGVATLSPQLAFNKSANSSFLSFVGVSGRNLAYSNRPLHMLEEGCDVGIMAGTITDDTVVARSIGSIKRYLVASPALLETHKAISSPIELQSWPWLALSGAHFSGGRALTLYSPGQKKQKLTITPVLTSEDVTSLREAARI